MRRPQLAVSAERPSPIDVRAELAEHARWLKTVLAARGVERESLDEVMQNVAASAARGSSKLRDAAKAGPWLYKIAVGQALMHRRSRGRRKKLLERYVDSGVCKREAIDADPLAWLLAEEQQQLVRRAISVLPRREAELLLLKYTEEWSYQEIADHMGLTVSAVEAKLHRARKRLRRQLATLTQQGPIQTNAR